MKMDTLLDEFLDPIGRCLYCGELFYEDGYPPNFCSDYCADKEVENLS